MLPFPAIVNGAPESLLDLCFKYVVQNLDTICSVDPFTRDYHLKEGLALPSEICERLIEIYQKCGNSVDDRFVNIFSNSHTTRLKRVRLRNSSITDDGLRVLLNHNLVELNISNCSEITEKSLQNINDRGDSIASLILGLSVNIFPDTLMSGIPCAQAINENICAYHKRGYILRTPNIRRLAIRNLFVEGKNLYFPVLVRPLHKLTHLDLSGCFNLGDLSYLCELPNLTSLVLHNVVGLQNALASLCNQKNLRHLDISQVVDKQGVYRCENHTLAMLVENLPNLVSLDISGTNLAGTGVALHSPASKSGDKESVARTDIPGLSSRVNNPFDFLGLYGTHHGACRRHDIPAKRSPLTAARLSPQIAGDANEEQIYYAAAANLDRPAVLQKVLNDLYHLFRYETCQNINYALGVVLEAMDRHINEKHIQISGSATLFYIVKGKDKTSFDMRTKHMVIGTLLNGMSAYRSDDTMMRNGCLTLCQFKIPEDVLFDYERLVHLLLHIVSEMEQESFVQRIGIYLLNSLACQVDGSQKKLLGDLGAINRMLGLIEDRLARRVCDDVLEVAWSTMWNVTDETSMNCQRFLDGRGMEFFLGCLRVFPDKEELLRNMMGLLGNVAEVRALRPRLMTMQFMCVFADLLDSCSDGIERMVDAINRWDLRTERNINYRSFEPISYLAKIYHTPQCQHWAVWALANLTTVYPAKYCFLLESEGGLTLLQEIIQHDQPYGQIKELAMLVIKNCRQFREQGQLPQDAQLDG
uniref:Zer-1-like protein n=1 Tax=Timema tahoe TaxID=61484 RepID=A0A7R9IB40_9NEOP|nr:unnamed protein product [Timema tahoe]